MFLWRWFKRFVFLAVLAGIAYVASGHVNWHGRPAREQVTTFFQSQLWKEGMKDFRTWFGALLQVAGKKIEEGVTPEDQKKLDAIIEGDLMKQVSVDKEDVTKKSEEKKEK